MEEENINICDILALLKKRYKLIIVIALSCVIIAGVFNFMIITPKYESNVELFIGKQDGKKGASYNNNEVQMYQKLLTTYAEVIKTNDLVKDAVTEARINLDGMTVKDILKNLVVTPRTDTQILKISYKDTNNYRAVQVVQAITNEFIKTSKELISNGSVKVIEKPNLPMTPVSPNKSLNMLIAFVLGIMISVGIVLLMEFMDNTFKNKDDLEKILNIPVLAAIPEYDIDNMKVVHHNHEKKKKLKYKIRWN